MYMEPILGLKNQILFLGIDGIQVEKSFYNGEKKLAFKRLTFKAPFNILFYIALNGDQSNNYGNSIDIPVLDDIDFAEDINISMAKKIQTII